MKKKFYLSLFVSVIASYIKAAQVDQSQGMSLWNTETHLNDASNDNQKKAVFCMHKAQSLSLLPAVLEEDNDRDDTLRESEKKRRGMRRAHSSNCACSPVNMFAKTDRSCEQESPTTRILREYNFKK